MIKTTLKKLQEPEMLAGLQNGGEKIIKCSNCNTPLAIAWITRPNEPDPFEPNKILTTKIKIKCYKCNDSSFEETIQGGYHIGGYHLKNKSDRVNVKAVTYLEYEDMVGDLVTYLAKKEGE